MKEIRLNPQQVEAVTHRDGPMIVLSVAGSGKTMVLIERIIHLIEAYSIDPAKLLAITFAKKAVLEIQSRLEKRLNGNGDKAMVCTFHSLGYRILKSQGYPVTGFRLVHDGEQINLFREAMDRTNVKEELNLLVSKVSLAKNDLISPFDLKQSDKPEDKEPARVYHWYELLKRRKRLIDFDDLLYLTYQLFKEDIGILEQYQSRFHHILVDEFQDSSKVMVELVKLLSARHQNVWLAGDDDQNIHSFRGARSDIFVSLEKEYGSETKTITMTHNYRSTRNILRAANSLISHNKVRVKKMMVTDNGEGEEIEILGAKNEIEEAAFIAQTIVGLKEIGYRYDEIAILVRVHKLMPLIEAALIRELIPYTSIAGFLYNRPTIKTVINIMKYLLSGNLAKGLDQALIEEKRAELFAHGEKISLTDGFQIASFYVLTSLENGVEDEEERSIKNLYLDAFEHLLTPHKNLDEFLEHVKEVKTESNGSYCGKVHLMTIHQAKGLQFKCVFVPGVNEGILPHIHSAEQFVNLEEERRLMFVSVTRAIERLFITYRRTQRAQPITTPSRFIKELSA